MLPPSPVRLERCAERSMGPATLRGCSRRALRRQAHSRDVGSAPEAWLMDRFVLLETHRPSAVRGDAPPLDYAPDGATLEASGGGARLRRTAPPTKWPAKAGFPLEVNAESSGFGARVSGVRVSGVRVSGTRVSGACCSGRVRGFRCRVRVRVRVRARVGERVRERNARERNARERNAQEECKGDPAVSWGKRPTRFPPPTRFPAPTRARTRTRTRTRTRQRKPRTLPEQQAPETRVPETRTPETRASETRVPETRVPETRLRE